MVERPTGNIILITDALVCIECGVVFSRHLSPLACPRCTQHATVLPLTDEFINKYLCRHSVKEGC